jgi:AraC-like DNA-binding protein
MVSLRCKMVVKAALNELGLRYRAIDLGEVDLIDSVTPTQLVSLKAKLAKSGLELMDDEKAVMVERIKNVVVEMIHYADELPKIKVSDYISEKLGHNYNALSNLFSEVTGTTIAHYIINHKIEKVKELLLYGQLSLKEISYKLGYSSEAHLSNQFKKVTGLTPTYFKKLQQYRRRIALEKV